MITSSKKLTLSKGTGLMLGLLAGASFCTTGAFAAENTNANKPAANAKETPKSTEATEVKAAPDNDGPIKIGYVNFDKIMRDSKAATEAEKKISEEFKKRDEELQKLSDNLRKKLQDADKNAAVMSDTDRANSEKELSDLEMQLNRKRRDFQEDLNRRRSDNLKSIISKVNTSIHNIAAKEGYDLILQDAVTVSDRVDVTPKVIEELNKQK